MNVCVEVESVGVRLDLESAAWTPELAETLLRMCADQAMRIYQTLGVDSDLAAGDEVTSADGADSDDSRTEGE